MWEFPYSLDAKEKKEMIPLQVNLSLVLSIVMGFLIGSLIVYSLDYVLSLIKSRRRKTRRFVREIIQESLASQSDEYREIYEFNLNEYLGVLQSALTLFLFSLSEISRKSKLPSDKVERILDKIVSIGALETYLSGGAKVYRVNLERNEIFQKIRSIIDFLENKRRVIDNPGLLNIEKDLRNVLINFGIRNIIYIEFNENKGPFLKYFVEPTRFVETLMQNPKYVTDIAIMSKTSPVMLIENTRVAVVNIATRPSKRVVENQLVAELFENSKEEFVLAILEEIAKSLSEKKEVTSGDLIDSLNTLKDIVK